MTLGPRRSHALRRPPSTSCRDKDGPEVNSTSAEAIIGLLFDCCLAAAARSERYSDVYNVQSERQEYLLGGCIAGYVCKAPHSRFEKY